MGKRGPKPGAKNAGRPPVELDEKMFIKYCQRGCTLDEISYYFEVDENTLNAWCLRTFNKTFSGVYKKHGAILNSMLRKAQINMALGVEERVEYPPEGGKIIHKGQPPNASMQIWLGKQRLGQSDQPVDESRQEVYKELPSLTQDDDD